MNKLMYFLCVVLLSIGMTACHNQPNQPVAEEPEIDDPTIESHMQLMVNGVGEILSDTTIVVQESNLNLLSGKIEMKLEGAIRGVDALRVVVTRSDKGLEDEFCALGACLMGDGEPEQVFDLTAFDDSDKWYVHYMVEKEGAYTVSYKFINYSRVVKLTVVFDYQGKE